MSRWGLRLDLGKWTKQNVKKKTTAVIKVTWSLKMKKANCRCFREDINPLCVRACTKRCPIIKNNMADTYLQVLMPDFSQLCLLTKNKLLNTMQVNNKFSECVDVRHLQGNTEAVCGTVSSHTTGPGSAPWILHLFIWDVQRALQASADTCQMMHLQEDVEVEVEVDRPSWAGCKLLWLVFIQQSTRDLNLVVEGQRLRSPSYFTFHFFLCYIKEMTCICIVFQ